MYEALLEYPAHVRVIPAERPENPYIGALFQHEIPEMLEKHLYVRFSTLRTLE